MGDAPDLVRFGSTLEGLKAAFKGCNIDVIDAPFKLSKAEIQGHMMAGDLRDMALSGDVDVCAWAKAGGDRSDKSTLKTSLDMLEEKIIAAGGYHMICGFSQGAEVAYELLQRLPTINSRCAKKCTLVVFCGAADETFLTTPPTASQLKGLKLFHMKGSEDGGYCDGCGERLVGEYFRCAQCYDFDFCAKCQADAAGTCRMLASKGALKAHAAGHKMNSRVPGRPIEASMMDSLSRSGFEVVANVQYEGGHVMPPKGSRAYEQLANFVQGKLRGTPM
jgi:hypothetical protein